MKTRWKETEQWWSVRTIATTADATLATLSPAIMSSFASSLPFSVPSQIMICDLITFLEDT